MADNTPKTIRDSLKIGQRGQLFGKVHPLTDVAAHVTGAISAEAATVANQRDITLVVRDANGNPVNYAAMVELIVFAASTMLDFTTTGGTTGIAAGGNGKILALVAKKVFLGITTTAGLLDVIYTDTGTDAAYLGVRLPNGRIVGIGTLTNA
jgi:hypothetical protein